MARILAASIALAFAFFAAQPELAAQSKQADVVPPAGTGTESHKQDGSITIPLTFEKKRAAESHGFIPLFEYGRADLIMFEGQERAIHAPELGADTYVAYGFVYFTGWPGGALDKNILVMIDGLDQLEPRYFVDLNNNLDLRDDTLAVELEDETGAYILTLHARDNSRHRFRVRCGWLQERPAYVERPEGLAEIAKLFQGFLARMGGTATSPEYWLYSQRLNTLSASVKRAGLSFQIGVHDLDCNGVYSDVGEDRILVGRYGDPFLSTEPNRGATTIGEHDSLIRLDGQTFEVLMVDPAGEFVRIRPSDKPYTRLTDGDLLPAFELTMLDDGRSVPLATFIEPGKYLLLDFWGHWCAPCIQTLPVLKYMDTAFGKQLTILGIHRGDHQKARELVQEHALVWPQAQATEKLIDTFMVDSWPYYVLVDSEKKIYRIGMELQAAIDLLQTESKNEKAQESR